MEYKSVFDFLKGDEGFHEIYKDCKSMEKEIISESFDLSFVKGRNVCEKLIKKFAKNDSRTAFLFSQKKDDGSPYIPNLAKVLWNCSQKRVLERKLLDKYYKIKKYGDAGAHGDNVDDYDITDCKLVHKLVFDIALHGYNEFCYPKDVSYFYDLDKFDYTIEISPEDREEELKNLHLNEVVPENIKESYKSKKIFLTIDSFKECVSEYLDEFEKKEEFLSDLENCRYVNDENINDLLYNVKEDIKSKIKDDAKRLSQEKSDKIIETLNELTEDLTFEEINEMVISAKDDNQREIYSFIKALSIDLVKNHLSRIKAEIENMPVTYVNENGRKVSKNKKYLIKEDDDGFFLENIYLDEDQKRAVEYSEDKPLVVNAGPGSGKTRILVERVVYLIKELNKDPSTMLVITYTNKATQELRNRLINDTDLPADAVSEIRISTVHGFCRHLINTYEHPSYNYLNRYGEKSLFFSKHKEDLGFKNYSYLYDYWIPYVLDVYGEYFNFDVNSHGLISYVKNKMKDKERHIDKFEKFIDRYHEKYGNDKFPDFEYLLEHNLQKGHYYHRFFTVASSYPKYKKLLEKNKTCDDDYVLEKAYNILNRENVRLNFQYKNILIDEFQDTDYNQMKIFEILLELCNFNNGDTFTIVGDSDQSIYGWRGSNPQFFDDYAGDEENFECIPIQKNYRSTRNIVEFNEELIKGYRNNEKKLIPAKSYGNPVFHLSSREFDDDEPERIMEILQTLKEDKKIRYYSDVALLFRLKDSINKFVEVFDRKDFPYHLTENNDFLNQKEVRSMLVLFWLLMPYQKEKFVYRSDDFLNISWLSDDFFGLSEETQTILNDMQVKYERNVIKLAREAFRLNDMFPKTLTYSNVFNQDEEIVNYVFDNIETCDLVTLDEPQLIELGITNKNDLEFFSRLRNLKSIMWDDELGYMEKPDSLSIFERLLNITPYFKETSIKGDEHSIRVKDNLALFSQIINDYESIMGSKNYRGLFNYLNGVLESYSCRRRDANEGFDKVHLITMHSAKGLEYPVVILCSLKDGICPKRFKNRKIYRTPDYLLANKPVNIQKEHRKEEMRLIYVAATRAKELLILSSISSNNQPPAFLDLLKRNRNVRIEALQPHNLTGINKISSSNIMQENETIKVLNLNEILSDYLFCPYRYDILNNTRFAVRIRNQKHVESELHQLIHAIHNKDGITDEEVDEKIQSKIRYHNLSSDEIANNMIENVGVYWRDYGKNYEVIKSNISLRKQMINCDIKGTVDLIVKENDDEVSIVQFIGSDYKIIDFLDEYMIYLYFYVSVLKNYDEFKEYRFKNIILHSIDNNKVHVVPYRSIYENDVLDSLEDIANNIVDEKFGKTLSRCVNCECNGNHC